MPQLSHNSNALGIVNLLEVPGYSSDIVTSTNISCKLYINRTLSYDFQLRTKLKKVIVTVHKH